MSGVGPKPGEGMHVYPRMSMAPRLWLALMAACALLACVSRAGHAPNGTPPVANAAQAERPGRPVAPGCSDDGIGPEAGTGQEELDVLIDRCDEADKCELGCLRRRCGSMRECRRTCRRAARRERGLEHDEDLGYRAAAAGFEGRDPLYCTAARGWDKTPAPPGPGQEFAAQARGTPSSHGHDECRIDPAKTDITEIAIERTACYGPCPIYWLRLHADGSAEMFGRAHVPHLGKHRGRLDPRVFQDLAGIALELGFFSFDDSYTCSVTDSPTVYTSITRRGRQKIIRHYAPSFTGPRSLKILEDKIDEYADAIEWSE